MHHSFYRSISPNYLIINHTHILSAAPFIFLPIIFAIGYVAIDYFKQKNVLLEKYTIAAKELVHSIDEMANDSVNIEATILRMNEILYALYECNKAYINAYVKIRDELFPEPTFINFIKQIGKKKANFSKISAADLGYLIEVTKYYNKINTSEV